MKKSFVSLRAAVVLPAALCLFGLGASPAFAVSKDMVQLETQIQQLQDAVARLQQSNDERMGVLKDLVQQSADSVNKMSLSIETLQRQVRAQQDAQGGKIDQVSGQVQSLNDSVDEVKARLNKLETTLQDVQRQQQSINAGLQNLSPAASGTGTPTPGGLNSPGIPQPDAQPITPAPTVPGKRGKPSASITPDAFAPAPAPAPVATAAPPVADLYRTALGDYMAAKYTLASTEFGEVIRNYPDDTLSGNAFYYMGEIDYRAGKFAQSVKDYDHVLDHFSDNNKIPVAHLHKGQALLVLKQNDAGVRELRALIQRFPNSPEATQARSRLNGMGVAIAPKVAH